MKKELKMLKSVQLGSRAGLRVSEIALGTMNFAYFQGGD
jgi:aryl-alcohol dehydrogenase-like predicted oxidoreductase